MPVCCENNAARACAIEGFRLKAEDCTFRETSKNISHLECAAHRPSCEESDYYLLEPGQESCSR